MGAKEDAIAELETAYNRFREKIVDLPDEAYRETWLGSWSLSELLAHMEGWADEMAASIERVGRGERPAPPGVDYGDTETWNAKFAAGAVKGRGALAPWEAAFARYIAAAKALDSSKYGTDEATGRPLIGNRLLTGAGIHHFAEHGEQLDEWLARRASG